MSNYLDGVLDVHVHCAPDVVERKVDDYALIKAAAEANLAGYVLKAHYEPTTQKANLLSKLFPNVKVIGSITLNHAVGGINPYAVETAAILGARVVWFPTFDSFEQLPIALREGIKSTPVQNKLSRMGKKVSGVSLLDENGQLLPDVHTVLELIADNDMVLASGHISHTESFALFSEAKRKGIKRMVLTHADWADNRYSIEEQKAFVHMGAMIEHSYVNYLLGARLGKITWDEICNEIRSVGVENVLYSTDLGQPQFCTPLEGLKNCMDGLVENGFPESDIDVIFRKNPKNIIF